MHWRIKKLMTSEKTPCVTQNQDSSNGGGYTFERLSEQQTERS